MTIRIIKNRTYRFSVNLYDGEGNPYTPALGERVVMTIKNAPLSTATVLVKDGPEIQIAPEDTKALPTGTYVYDVVLLRENGEIYTVIPPPGNPLAYADFIVEGGVYNG